MSLLLSVIVVLALPVSSLIDQRPPRDPRPADVARAAASENTKAQAALQKQIAAEPDKIELRVKLAELQEQGGQYDAAEATLQAAARAFPTRMEPLTALAGFYNRIGNFEKTMTALQATEQIEPLKREHPMRVATFYWEKAFRDQKLNEEQKRTYIQAGIAATDRALAIDANYAEALTYKNILLRMQANMEPDPALQQQLISQANQLRARALQLNKQNVPQGMPPRERVAAPPPPPPPPPGAEVSGAMQPVRVGGNISAPTKVKDVKPVYPEDAKAARMQGVVILEITIDPAGLVSGAKVLRSIPLLDQAALDAVRQWEFTPTLLNGAPVPVIMTVTVNFTLQ